VEQQQRLLLAFALSILLWVAYQELVLKRYETPTVPEETAIEPRSTPNTTLPPATAAPDVAALGAPLDAAPTVAVDTDLFRAVVTLRGGRMSSLTLKRYRETVTPDSPPLELVQPGDVLPLTLRLTGGQADAGVLYRADTEMVRVRGPERHDLVLRGALPDGRSIEKRLTFQGDLYEFEVTAAVERAPETSLVLPAIRSRDPASIGWETIVALQGNAYVYNRLSDLDQEGLALEQATWSGFASTYFLTALVPLAGPSDARYELMGSLPVGWQEAAGDSVARFAVYVGPKDEASLERAGHDLKRALDFGYFWFAAVPLLEALRFLKGLTGNWGVAIILLTTFIKIVTIPLTQTSFRSMREMQKIQPQMAKIRERYKDDPSALQKEMLELYRRHRVNPFSGCLPILLQMPIFIGLYNALSSAIELRHAPFALWITDLSAPDRLMLPGGLWLPVLTLLMGASMLVQQWITPQQGDPTQQRLMMLMPIVFTFMFISFPSGLVLYWLVNNVLTIAHQYWMLRGSR
jgi:YidC/Oxa1 family membrane protein insertase